MTSALTDKTARDLDAAATAHRESTAKLLAGLKGWLDGLDPSKLTEPDRRSVHHEVVCTVRELAHSEAQTEHGVTGGRITARHVERALRDTGCDLDRAVELLALRHAAKVARRRARRCRATQTQRNARDEVRAHQAPATMSRGRAARPASNTRTRGSRRAQQDTRSGSRGDPDESSDPEPPAPAPGAQRQTVGGNSINAEQQPPNPKGGRR